MIKVFYGDNRVKANQDIKKILGVDYEVIEGSDINPNDLPSVFLGASLFNPTRHILIRDFSANKLAYEQLPKFINTPHDVILLETKLDKRSTIYKELKDKIEFREYKLPEDPNLKLVFDIYRVAKTDGPRAIKMLSNIKPTEDPIKFTGLLVSQALRDFTNRQGIKEKKTLQNLAHLDLAMKSKKIDPWLLVESFLLELSTF